MSQDLITKAKETAELYYKDVKGERPYKLWRDFDRELAQELPLFIIGQMYSREKIPHPTRQLVTIAALTVLSRHDELRLHIQAAFNVGCLPSEISEVIFQMAIYGGVPTTNSALKILREVMQDRGLWPPPEPATDESTT